ncbi:MAG TPA: hypothetical protein VIX58_07040, partial [Anaerolineae bacterium]
MKKLALLAFVALVLLGSTRSASAQAAITVTRADFKNTFPVAMTFTLEASSTADIQSAALIVRLLGLASSSRYTPKF